jgi:hypothetical protein
MRYVPAGPAFRVGLQKRRADSSYRNFGAAGEPRSDDEAALVRAGANKMVCNALYHERKAGRLVEFTGADAKPWLKMSDESD